MASTPVTAPATPPPSSPPPQAKSPPPEAATSPPPPQAKSPPQPPPEAKAPPPEAKSPPPAASTPPSPAATPPPPKASEPPPSLPPPSTTTPPQQLPPQSPTKPLVPPSTPLPTPTAPAGNTTPQTPQPPATVFPPPSENAGLSPPFRSTDSPISPPTPSQPKATPSSPSGELPPPHRTPSSSSTPSHDRSSPSPRSDSLTEKLPVIVGVAAGAGLLCVIMILFYMVCSKKKKKGGSLDQVQYYGDPRNGPKGYYDNGAMYNNNPQMNQSKIPQPPGYMGPPGGGWQHHQSPASHSDEMGSDTHYASPGGNMGFNKSTFTYDDLAAATNGFSQANLLGQGGFGYVHKGILPNGKVVAVKSLKSGSGQGEREFQAEVEIISRVHHRHLVSLVGYCIAGAQRMLVYEFVPNQTMEYHLHGQDCPTMEWHKRLTIALGSAKGLAYLHEDCHPRIIHRDIKAANILIDNNFEAMVADFGLAKLSQDNITHVSTRVMGTFGYMAPEYASSGKLSDKSDVFSFGVMLLELITGRRPIDTTNSYMDDSLVDWARPIMTQALKDGNFDELVDPLLNGIYDRIEMERMIACAAASIRHSSRRRPKMSQIVRALEGDASLDALNEVAQPGQAMSSSETYDTALYNADLKKFRQMALGTSTEYSGVTSSYGVNPSSSSDSGEVNHPGKTHPK